MGIFEGVLVCAILIFEGFHRKGIDMLPYLLILIIMWYTSWGDQLKKGFFLQGNWWIK